ncbi:hypothetical protein Xmau_02723 [Xenorhabdus mauleonii]|uniref:Uncharacterized protein n=1 Tax=Xenorhabdus mauleonii TaxID=351675 RepID=A0A1I3I7G3_9GAMM|nr:hypothetical protein Xmau_02723 [Xenorhabdus mauleonii]SFI43800.1 hypothetical protein SAMN05421680_101221 [Xenorhabdus mauleonii]
MYNIFSVGPISNPVNQSCINRWRRKGDASKNKAPESLKAHPMPTFRKIIRRL